MFKLSQDNDNDSTSSDLGAVVLEKEPEVKEPPSYQVVLINDDYTPCLLYTSPSPRDLSTSRMPSSA